jgi:hypothetical protein
MQATFLPSCPSLYNAHNIAFDKCITRRGLSSFTDLLCLRLSQIYLPTGLRRWGTALKKEKDERERKTH